MKVMQFLTSFLRLDTDLKKRRLVGLLLAVIALTLFLALNRFPKLDTIDADLAIVTSPVAECFQGFCLENVESKPLIERWWSFSVNYLRLVWIGMVFAFAMAGITEAFVFPSDISQRFTGRGFTGVLKGVIGGPVVNLCSACIVPIATAFRKRGAGLETTVAITQSSSTMNLPALVMATLVFIPLIGGSRIALSILGAFLLGPLVAWVVGRNSGESDSFDDTNDSVNLDLPDGITWSESIGQASLQFLRATFHQMLRLGPIMILAGFGSGLVIQWISPQTITTWIGDDVVGIVVAASVGIAINVPLMFEIPLVAAMLLAGMGTAPAGSLLFTAAAGGPITFWGLAKVMPRRGIFTLAIATWILGIAGGLVLLLVTSILEEERVFSFRANYTNQNSNATLKLPPPPRIPELVGEPEPSTVNNSVPSPSVVTNNVAVGSDSLGNEPTSIDEIDAFQNIVVSGLLDGYNYLSNDLPGVAIFDFDRDGDQDLFFTQDEGNPNLFFENDGKGNFLEKASLVGLSSHVSAATGVVACDLDNDGYQDLYVSAQGRIGDNKNYLDAVNEPELKAVHMDRLFRNKTDGTFEDVTEEAFGDAVNLRTGSSIGCADVNNDGLNDLYVANREDLDSFHVDNPSQGNLNVMYLNKGELKFDEVAKEAGVMGELTVTWAVLFYDFDDDMDVDLWTAEDGGRLKVYRNDSTQTQVKFVPVERAMGIDKVGSWMGFALGDYDGDSDLDVFVTNIGYHPRLRPPPFDDSADCASVQRYEWGTCDHFLLKNGGLKYSPGFGVLGSYSDVAYSIVVEPSRLLPPLSLDPTRILNSWQVPTGLAAYDFGFGAVFFDMENDGDEDLYWLGSALGRGESRLGPAFPSAGRMLRNMYRGDYQDVTVETQLLAIEGVDYGVTDRKDPRFDADLQRISFKYHENGKGVASGDLNGDGYMDLIGTNGSGEYLDPQGETITKGGPIFVWINPGGERSWINLRLEGGGSSGGGLTNRDAIGARIYVTADIDGKDDLVTQVSEVMASSSFLSMSSLDQHFGLGIASKVDKVEVIWPSGVSQTIYDIPLNTTTLIAEPK